MSKVVISGFDTANLPLLNRDEMVSTMAALKGGCEDSRQKFINSNMRLVLSISQRYANRRENMDDIFQVGCVGLIKAIDNFDVTVGVKFSTYAVPMIIGEIRRFLRDNNSVRVSRSIRDTAYKTLQARERLSRTSQNDPTFEEIAAELGIPVSEVVCALDAISDPVSLFDPVFDDSTDTVLLIDQIRDEKSGDDMWNERIILKDGLDELDEREKDILHLRYFIGKTQMEISEEIGISQAQVSRLEKNALKQIKQKF
ncbi:MAG: RNA polymerase sporulation sigma factor SigG [Firmicutes bacterium]|nr:RNA polymerase sporulation sigma factor SigG [Bacillota bacterium]